MTPLQYLAEKSGVAESNISKWAKDESHNVEKTSRLIVADLSRKPRANRWFPDAERKLYSLFQARRKNKQKVSTRWISVTFKKILREDHADDRRSLAFRASYRWARKWAKSHNLSTRRKSNSKNKSVQERLPKIQRWHKRFRQLLREPRYQSGKVVEGSASMEPASASTGGSAEEAESEPASSRTNGESTEEAESHAK